MKRLMAISVLACLLAGLTHADDWVTNNPTLNLLRRDFTNRVYVVASNRVEASFVWISKPYAVTCQRPLSLYLVSNQVGAFVNPKGWAFTNSAEPFAELMVQIAKDVGAYLHERNIKEKKVATGSDRNFYEYLLNDTQNQAPEGTARKLAAPQR